MLLLASTSPRRRELLRQLGVPFEVITAPVEEYEATDADPRLLVEHNARLKAAAVSRLHPGRFVLGADTTVCVGRTVLNKPADLDDARRMLRLLSGHAHEVHTAIALVRGEPEFEVCEVVTSQVEFRTLSEADIERYLAAVHVLDKAGAYAIQDHGDWIVSRYTGSLDNIIGLPTAETAVLLRSHGLLS